jgi:3-phenylpropionate/trans-cinnamate dioxygenase ferredoxin reductase component
VTNRIVVVGGGLVGAKIVESLRSNGYDGDLTLVGDEVHPPYDRPPLSKQMLTVGGPEASISRLISEEKLAALGVGWRPGAAATGLDTVRRTVAIADGSTLAFDRLAVATGATPIQLPGSERLAGVQVLRTLDDCRRLRESLGSAEWVTVLGGGVLGCEIAATLSGARVKVRLIEAADSLLPRAVPHGALSDALRRMHEAAGVQVMLGSKVDVLIGDGRVSGAALSDGCSFATDLVVVAIGSRPSTQWLGGSGLALDDGVLCDEHLQTNVRGVFAAGDVARQRSPDLGVAVRHEHWTAAVDHARIAAHNLVADDADLIVSQARSYVWSDQFGRRLQIVGQPGASRADEIIEHVVMRDDASDRILVLYTRPDSTVLGAAAIGAPKAIAKLGIILRSPLRFEDAVDAIAGDR